ncbi:MAG: T9SS type A sorting domain-containing protein [Bacteroidia bacterium]
MIKKLLSIALIAVGFTANAQQFKIAKTPTAKPHNSATAMRLGGGNSVLTPAADTLYPASLTGTGCGLQTGGSAYYQLDADATVDTGFVFGTNAQPFTQGGVTYTISLPECAQKYNVTGSASVTGVLMAAGVAHSSGSTTLVSKIYAQDLTTKGPTSPTVAALGTTGTVALSSVSTTAFTTFTFGTPVPVTNQNFFASVVYPSYIGGTSQDSLAILSTAFGCSSTDSLAWIRETAIAPGGAVVLNKWYSVKKLFNGNLDLWIFPILDFTTGMNGNVTKNGLSLYAASPNPTSNNININFSLAHNSNVEIEIFDVTGKSVKTVKGGEFAAGKGSVAVDVANLDAGSYMYSITTKGAKMFSKFVVVK